MTEDLRGIGRRRRAGPPSARRWIDRIVLAGLTGLVAVIGVHAVGQALADLGSTDLHSYWYAGQFVRAGRDPYAAWLRGEAAPTPDPVPSYVDPVTPGAPANVDRVSPGVPAAVARVSPGAAANVDRVTPGAPQVDPELATTPSNTAPMVLTLAPLALLPWPTARLVWLALNLVLALTAPVLVWRLCPSCRALGGAWLLTGVLLFLLLQGTRIAVWVGQTTLLVFVLMLGALHLADRRPILAGFMLGVALSKYPVALPALLVVLASRQWRVIGVAIVVQVAAALGVAALGGSDPATVWAAYLALARLHTGLPGVHLGSMLPAAPGVQVAASIGLTAAVVVAWVAPRRRVGSRPDDVLPPGASPAMNDGADAERASASGSDGVDAQRETAGLPDGAGTDRASARCSGGAEADRASASGSDRADAERASASGRDRADAERASASGGDRADAERASASGGDRADAERARKAFALLSVLVPWSLLVVYHRAYDTLVAIVPLVLFVAAIAAPREFGLASRGRAGVLIVTLAVAGVLCLPSSLAGLVLPAAAMPAWYAVASAGTTVALGLTLATALWLAGRSARPVRG